MTDLEIAVVIADDKLHAYLVLRKLGDRPAVTRQELEQILSDHHVCHGVQWDVVERIAHDPSAFVGDPVLVAKGDPPVHGVDGSIRMLVEESESVRPSETESGAVDFREVRRLSNVRKGQKIAERIPAQPGVDGKSVTGAVLPAKRPKEAVFKLGKNVVLDPDRLSLYAAIDGLVVRTEGDKINVFPVYEVNGDVDYRVGNIDFVGNVVIRGNVRDGFRVRADGDIRVIGGVEGAELFAGGSIEITAGIFGHQKGLVKAGKNVKCSFILDANVEAGENVIVSQSIMHSQVRAGIGVFCEGNKGLIVGGTIQAGERVRARTVGNAMSTPTSLEVGVRPELRNELVALRNSVKTLTDTLEKTDKALALLDQLAAAGPLPPEKMSMRLKLGNTKKQVSEELAAARERIFEIEKMLDSIDQARVEILSMVYGGTKIVIGRYVRFVNDPISRVYFCYADGDIALRPLKT